MKNILQYAVLPGLLVFSINCKKVDLQQDTTPLQEENTRVTKRFSEGEVIEYSGIAKPSVLGDFCYCIDNFGNKQVEPAAVHLHEKNKPGLDISGKRVSVKGLLLKTTIGSDAPNAQLPLQPLYYMDEYELTVIE